MKNRAEAWQRQQPYGTNCGSSKESQIRPNHAQVTVQSTHCDAHPAEHLLWKISKQGMHW
jgi:hypothetical protein